MRLPRRIRRRAIRSTPTVWQHHAAQRLYDTSRATHAIHAIHATYATRATHATHATHTTSSWPTTRRQGDRDALARTMSYAFSPAVSMAELGSAIQLWNQQPPAANRKPLVMVLCPSRELCAQVGLQTYELFGVSVRATTCHSNPPPPLHHHHHGGHKATVATMATRPRDYEAFQWWSARRFHPFRFDQPSSTNPAIEASGGIEITHRCPDPRATFARSTNQTTAAASSTFEARAAPGSWACSTPMTLSALMS